LLALDQLPRKAVLPQGADMVAHVVGLLLRDRQAEQPDLPERLSCFELGRELVDLPLCLERPGVDRPRPLDAEALAGVVVERGCARDQKAAVASARATRDGPGLEQHRLDPALRKTARA